MIWETIEPIVQKIEDDHTFEEWRHLLEKWEGYTWHNHELPSEKTNVLMIDANAVTTNGRPDLNSLHDLLKDHVQASISDLYLVSLFPYAVNTTDTAIDPRIQLFEDLGHFKHEFELMYDMEPEVYNEMQFDVLKETDTLIELLAKGATKIRVHVQSFRGMPEDSIRNVCKLWHTVLHHYKPYGQLILAYDMVDGAIETFVEVSDVICHFDLSSHTILAFAQENATRLSDWASRIDVPPSNKTYFNFLSMAERDPFEKNLIEPSVEMILAAHSILFSLQGIPSIDYRTLLGVQMPVEHDTLVQELKTDPYRLQVFSGITSQLNVKRIHPALSPYAKQRIVNSDSRVFAVERSGAGETMTLYTNVSPDAVSIRVNGTNAFTEEPVESVTLEPYGYIWIIH